MLALLAVYALIQLGAIAVASRQASLIGKEIEVPGSVGVAALTRNDELYAATGLAMLIVYLIVGVLSLVWLFRARDNAEAASPLPHRRSKVWLVLGWIVPVVSLWFPKQIMDDIWRSSDPATPASATSPDGLRNPGLVTSWWALWLISNVVGMVFFRMTLDATTLADIRSAAIFDAVTTPFTLAAALLFALVVWRISEFQEARRTAQETNLVG